MGAASESGSTADEDWSVGVSEAAAIVQNAQTKAVSDRKIGLKNELAASIADPSDQFHTREFSAYHIPDLLIEPNLRRILLAICSQPGPGV
ncbi:MAG: hypothetical protein Fues2KO_53650 [Fuerstiella sp.]